MAEKKKRRDNAFDDDFSDYDNTVKEEDMRGTGKRKTARGEKTQFSEEKRKASDDVRRDSVKNDGTAKAKTKKPANPSSVGNQIMIAVLAALAIFMGICFAAAEKVGTIGGFISEFFPGIFGGAALLIPFLLLFHAIYWKRDAASGTRFFRLMFSFAVVLFLSVEGTPFFPLFSVKS